MNVRTLCLYILNLEDATGYAIRKMSMDGKYSYFVDASYGSIYPALNRLESDRCVVYRQVSTVGKPTRKIYSITQKGRQELLKSLMEPPAVDIFRSEFLMIAVSASTLPQQTVKKAIDTRRKQLEHEIEHLIEIEKDSTHPSLLWALRYGQHCLNQSLNYLNTHSHLLVTMAQNDSDITSTTSIEANESWSTSKISIGAHGGSNGFSS